MSSYYTRKEIEELHNDIAALVTKTVGQEDRTVVNTIESCLHSSGYDKKRMSDKLTALLDSKKSSRLMDKLQQRLDDFRGDGGGGGGRSRKRIGAHADDSEPVKKSRFDAGANNSGKNGEADATAGSATPVSVATAASSLSSTQIKQMMANAQREIEERKRALNNLKARDPLLASVPQIGLPVAMASQVLAKKPTPEDAEKARKIAELQAQIRAKLSGSLASLIPAAQATDRPKPLILDDEGRTIDKSGRAINIPVLTPTLKANIRAKKREVFNKNQVAERVANAQDESLKFFDERIAQKPMVRNKRTLRFHEPGKFQQMAERLRMKTQLEKLQNEISQIARKTGISSATKLALIAPKQDTPDDVPSMEWWDSVILSNDLNTLDADGKISIRLSAISNLIEHPTQMKPPSKFVFCILSASVTLCILISIFMFLALFKKKKAIYYFA